MTQGEADSDLFCLVVRTLSGVGKEAMRQLTVILISILLLFLGAFGMIVSLFLPLIYLDIDPPRWLSFPLAFGVSLACFAAGIAAGVMAWRRRNC